MICEIKQKFCTFTQHASVHQWTRHEGMTDNGVTRHTGDCTEEGSQIWEKKKRSCDQKKFYSDRIVTKLLKSNFLYFFYFINYFYNFFTQIL